MNQFLLCLKKWIRDKCVHTSRINLTCNLVLFGTDRNVKTDEVLDFIILLVKQFIYNCKYRNTLPTLEAFTKHLKHRYAIEEYNAKVHLNFANFVAKWNLYKPLLV